MESRKDHVLPLFSTHDVLDKSLYIRPRLKQSAPLRTILSESYQDKERHWLPVEFRKLITQFMIANRYVFKAAHLYFQASLFESLLSRLDLHPDGNNSAERILLRINVKRVEKFIESRSKDWQRKGYLHQRNLADGVLEVTFAEHMLEWINPSYQGKMTMLKGLKTVPYQSGLEVLVDKADEEVGEEEEEEEEELYCIATICRKEVEAAAQDLIPEQNMALQRNGSEEVGPFDKTEAEGEKTNSYLKYEERVRAAVEKMLSLQEQVVAWRQKMPVRQVNDAGEGEQEEEDGFTYESMIRAEAYDTITSLDCTSLSPSGSVGGSHRHDIYQDGKYPATYRNILLQQKGKGRCSSTTSQARPANSASSYVQSIKSAHATTQHQPQTSQFATLNLANSTPRAHTPSPRRSKDRLAAKNVTLAKEILDDTLMADGDAIELRSRRQFGYVQRLLDMAQDSLPTGENVEMED